jgi:hypothetical protein
MKGEARYKARWKWQLLEVVLKLLELSHTYKHIATAMQPFLPDTLYHSLKSFRRKQPPCNSSRMIHLHDYDVF